ncbi:MAG: beta-propeller domain-containing protein [Bacilli bacterium]|nr:beta-propeller domain-containing protein [Bacilli bacterium]MDD4388913.1 beta-propeller domain-containing protein [Bacilli bacterium]
MKKLIIIITVFLSILVLGGCNIKGNYNKDSYEIQSISSYSELKRLLKPKTSLFDFLKPKSYKDANNDAIPEAGANEDYSTTNIQVTGVDEADVVKNDGRYIYIANYLGVVIIDTNNNEVFKYQYDDFYPSEMYLHENYLVVIGLKDDYQYHVDYILGRDCLCYRMGEFSVKVFDITNKSQITLSREVSIPSGRYVSSRMIDNDIYFLLRANTYDYNTKKVYIPEYSDSVIDNKLHKLTIDQIKICGGTEHFYGYNLLLSFNITNQDAAHIEAYLGNFSKVYASRNNLYVANTIYKHFNNGFGDVDIDTLDDNTLVYRFEIIEGKLVYKAQNIIPGQILNQFSMDEYDNYFRIVTTYNQQSAAYVLSLNDDFKIISKIDGIGIGERVYSVRFERERGYVVTFRNIDPLYIIDFSNPYELKIISELKSPGVSDYLHKYNDNLLIGVGRNIVDNLNRGVKISLFDITNETEPIEKDIYHIEGEYSYTELQYNHKVLLNYKKLNIFALPVYVDNYLCQNQGMYVFQINEDDQKILLLGIITNSNNIKGYSGEDFITRGVIINDYIYSISQNNVQVNDLNNDLTLVKMIGIK